MKAIAITVLLISISLCSFAQKSYRAIYRDNIENDYMELVKQGRVKEMLADKEDSAKLTAEMTKWLQSRIIHSMLCTPSAIKTEGFLENSGNYKDAATGAGARNKGYAILDLNTYILYSVSTEGGVTTTKCKQVDTTVLQFEKTGRRKTINNWECEEYIPIQDEYKKLTIWISEELPDYVRPKYLCTANIKGGVVRTEVKHRNSMCTLESLTEITPGIEDIPCMTTEKTINLLREHLSWYDDELLFD